MAHFSVSEKLNPKPAEEIKTPGVKLSPTNKTDAQTAYNQFLADRAAKGIPEKTAKETAKENGSAPKTPNKLPGMTGIEETPMAATVGVGVALGALFMGLAGRTMGKRIDAARSALENAKKAAASDRFKGLSDMHGADKAREIMAESSPEWAAGLKQSREDLMRAKAKNAPPSP